MMKTLLRTTLLAAVVTAVVAGSASAQQTATQTVSLTVASSNDFTVTGAPTLAPAAITAGQDTSVAADSATAKYNVSTNATGTTSGSITAHISSGGVPTGTSLLVKFVATGDNVATEQQLNGVTSASPVQVLSGLSNETVTDGGIIYTFKVTAAATPTITPTDVVVTYTFTPAA